MLVGAPTSPPTLSTTTSPASRTFLTRTERGIDYLRNYSQGHVSTERSSPPPVSPTRSPSRRPQLQVPSPPVQPRGRVPSTTAQSQRSEPEPIRHGTQSPLEGWLPVVGGSTGTARPTTQLQSTTPARASVLQSSMTEAGSTIDTGMTRTQASTTTHPHAQTLPTPVGHQEFYSTAHLFDPPSSLRGETAEETYAGQHTQNALSDGFNNGSPANPGLPMIQFLPHTEGRPNRPSLEFQPISRTLPHNSCIIRVGRYSERDNTPEDRPNVPSDSPIGFKSKVVSRRHCEFSYTNSQWYIKDVKSSSGTFLNHIRLSQPGVESRLFPVNDGDIVQLGIDFKGGEEMIYRCVKIRIECNRGWQKSLNKFNKSTHQRLKDLAKSRSNRDSDAGSKHSTECTICLNSISPCQALFVAPCSHTWHYKCIRKMLDQTHSHFLCPNCRARADLDADVDEPLDFDEEWEDHGELESHQHGGTTEVPPSPPSMEVLTQQNTANSIRDHTDSEEILTQALNGVSLHDAGSSDPSNPFRHFRSRDTTQNTSENGLQGRQPRFNPGAEVFVPGPSTTGSVAQISTANRFPVRIESMQPLVLGSLSATVDTAMQRNVGPDSLHVQSDLWRNQSASEDERLSPFTSLHNDLRLGTDGGPMTPRNNAGPFVLDGGDGREQNETRDTGGINENSNGVAAA